MSLVFHEGAGSNMAILSLPQGVSNAYGYVASLGYELMELYDQLSTNVYIAIVDKAYPDIPLDVLEQLHLA